MKAKLEGHLSYANLKTILALRTLAHTIGGDLLFWGFRLIVSLISSALDLSATAPHLPETKAS